MRIRELIKNRLRRSIETERTLERPFEKFSRILWPWSESKLVLFVNLMAILDYFSTYVAFELSRNNQVTEVGLLAKWVLQTGGFLELFLVEMTVMVVLILLAMGARLLYTRLGFPGFGRTAFVFLLIPYALIIVAVVFNNILVAFLGHS